MASGVMHRRSMEHYNDHVELKDTAKSTSSPVSELNTSDDMGVWNDSHNDMADMQRLGKKQEFKRNFSFWSALGFVSIYMATWEFVLVSLSVGFAGGGFAGLFWCFITTVICYASIVASLAEMESMLFVKDVSDTRRYAPTAGGQYHWVSEFAPPQYQKVLSYASGWMSTLGWLASVASSTYVVTAQIEAMVDVYKPDFALSSWQYTLIMWVFTLVTIVFNTYAASILPTLEIASLVGHLVGFIVTLVPLLVLAPKNSAYDVFVRFENSSGYSSNGAAFLISQVTIIYCNLGSDSVVHISEEVNDASITVPRCMWWSYIGNVFLGIIMLIAMLFCIGPLDDVLQSDVPYLLLFNRTGSPVLSLVLNIILFALVYSGNVTALATCGREVWAFSRDKGLPFSSWISVMNPRYNIPFNAVYATSVFVAILCLIQLGSTLAFNIIVSLSVLGLLSTYMISIGCVLLKRLRHEPLPHARWSLGRFGIPINAFALFYSAFIIVFCCFPTALPVDASSANWSPLIWAAVIVISVVFYVAYGKRHYTAPVEFVEDRKLDGVGVQSS